MYRPPLPFRCPTCRANINPTCLRDYNVTVVAPTQDQIERDEQEVYILNDEIYSRSSRSIQMIEEAVGHVRRQPVLRASCNLNDPDTVMIGIREARIAAMFTGYPLIHYLVLKQNVFVGRTKPNNTFYVEPLNDPQTLFLINAYYGLGSNLCTYYFRVTADARIDELGELWQKAEFEDGWITSPDKLPASEPTWTYQTEVML